VILPLTVAMPQMGTIGKGIVVLVTKGPNDGWLVTVLNMVAIYSGIGLRDDSLNAALGGALVHARSTDHFLLPTLQTKSPSSFV
jgi:hypothetical protein